MTRPDLTSVMSMGVLAVVMLGILLMMVAAMFFWFNP